MDAVDEIKGKLAVEDVVSEYVQLKRSGRNFKGLSPFTSEHTPSFMVSPEKQIWHDFSSGKGGDIFSFIMEVEGLDFKEALNLLARKAGLDLAQFTRDGDYGPSSQKERLYKAVELAAKFYQVQFSKNKLALDYVFNKRKFNKEIIIKFQIGYSPNNGDALFKFLTKHGFNKKELTLAGLITKSYRTSDMFKGRLMIPLADGQGRVIGFTARLLDDDNRQSKYINSPQTPIYDKSRHIFGLHLAKESIRKNDYVVIAEGNLDVIASHMVGVNQVVATAGTALTQQQLKALSNLTSDVRLAFDSDKAGQSATERAIPLASSIGINLSVIDIPNGKDPDELIQQDPEIWEQTINNYSYAIDWLISSYKQRIDISSATGKKKLSDIVLPLIYQLNDPVEIDHYLTYLAKLIDIDKTALIQKGTTNDSQKPTVLKRVKTSSEIDDKDLNERIKCQDQLLALALLNIQLREFINNIEAGMLVKEEPRTLLDFLKQNPEFNSDPITEPKLRKLTDYVKILLLQYEAIYQDLDETELSYEAKRLQDRLITIYVKHAKSLLAKGLEAADKNKTNQILKQARELDNLLKKT